MTRSILLAAAVAGLSGCAGISRPSRDPDYEKTFVTTGYCSCGRCCGWRRNWCFRAVDKATGKPKVVGQTASGRMAGSGTIAGPRGIPFGTIMYVEGYGYGRVEDRGGAIQGNRLDLWFRSHSCAAKWGKRSVRVEVWLPQASEQDRPRSRGRR